MIDHISLRVSDYDRAITFYKAALKSIGYELIMEFPGFAGFGPRGKPNFWVTRSDKPINPTHIAFATDRKTVHAFHQAALAGGGRDEGAPGPRPDYHANYYGAFVLDPDGNNIEACCHAPEEAAKKATRKTAKTAKAAKKPAARKPAAKAPARKPAKKPARRR
jgi:catechol 2,3-dioxygenase-like lactoylglutathione lyase family enzyme